MSLRENVAKRLLPELKHGKLEWWYISVAGPDGFDSAWLIEARGPTEAWCLLHRLYRMPDGCETNTWGPVIVASVSEDKRWRRLNRTEAEGLGK